MKYSSDKRIFTFLKALFAVAAVALTGIRIYQYFYLIETETGFYDHMDASVYIMNTVLAVVIILAIIMSYISKRVVAPDSRKEMPLGIVSVIAGIVFIAQFAASIPDLVDMLPFGGMTAESANTTDMIISIARTICALLSAWFFIWFGSRKLSGESTDGKPVLYITPALWATCRLLQIFMMATTFINVTTLLFELFSLVFSMLFFFAMGRTETHLDERKVLWRVSGLGFPCALFLLLTSAPQLIYDLVSSVRGTIQIGAYDVFSSLCYLMISIFIFVYLYSSNTGEIENQTEYDG